jgi:hypothetical protein
MRTVTDPARNRCSPTVLGLVGTLLVHALFLQSLIHGTATLGARFPQSALTLVLIRSTDAADSTSKLIEESISRNREAMRQPISVANLARLPMLEIGAELESGDRRDSASVAEEMAFRKTCRRIYPDDIPLKRDLAGVSLLSPVMPGQRIEPADFRISSGDEQRALMALRCLQAFGTVGPAS